MNREVNIAISAQVNTNVVIKKARAAVTLATDNKSNSAIPILLLTVYNKSINALKQKDDQ